ncbi:MAG: NACHT domain-containing protein [Chloroflexi bacterium]|nr:NACHT domain-containing protein [Chloroflexota bacterium]
MTLESIAGAAGAWLWDNYGKAIADQAIGAAKERWAKFNWSQAAEKYRRRVKELYGTTRILGNPKPIPLEGIFTDAYLLDKPTALRRFDMEQLKALAAEGEALQLYGERRSALRLALEEKRLFILGKPGAGKTTFLKYVALQAANGKINKIPIFVSLKEWADSGLELMPFLVRQFEICAFPEAQPFIEHLLNAGQAIVLFDGLDEVNQEDEQRAQITANVNNFSKQYASSQCLITCRLAATDYTFDQFAYVEMADFDDKQIRVFVRKWFKDNPAKRDKFLVEFAQEEHKGLRELAQIPLLLTLLCLAFDETMSFPQRRVELYEEALDALLKKWDSSRNIKRDEIYRKLSLGRKRQMLARIAAETCERGENFFRQADLAKRITRYLQKLPPADFDEDIDGEAVLKAIEAQHGLLVERAHRIYSFSHLTFQEYFTAKYIAEDTSKGTLARVIEQHFTDDRWREVFLLIASMLGNADTFFTLFRQAIDDLIRNDEKLVELVHWAKQKGARDYATVGYEGRSFGLTLTVVLTLDHALNPTLVRDLMNFLNLDLDRALDLNLALFLNLALAHDLVVALGYDREFVYAFTYHFTEALKLSQKLNLSNLHQGLRHLTIPNKNSSALEWQIFTRDLRAIMTSQRDIGHFWNLTGAQSTRAYQYQKANLLLLNCLRLAYVSDRAGIENSLWLPPGEKRQA